VRGHVLITATINTEDVDKLSVTVFQVTVGRQ
jgi:hypothetical protein